MKNTDRNNNIEINEENYIENSDIQLGQIKYVYMLNKIIYDILGRSVFAEGIRCALKNHTNYSPVNTIILGEELTLEDINLSEIKSILYNIHSDISLILKKSDLLRPDIHGFVGLKIYPQNENELSVNESLEKDVPNFQEFLKNYLEIIGISINIIKNIYKNKNLFNWLNKLQKENQKIREYLRKLTVYTDFNNVKFVNDIKKLEGYFSTYDNNFQKLWVSEDFEEEIDEPKYLNIEETPTQSLKTKELTESELKLQKEKELLIKQTNDTYFELCADLVDLDDQVPYVAKEYYKKFMSNFEAFNKSFKMPLTNDVSYEIAKKANRQLNSLLDYITNEISAKSYVEWGK